MTVSELNVVTGAFGFTGKYIARRLLSMGKRVKTLIAHPNRPNPFGDQVSVAPFNFDKPVELEKSLRGAATLYNTYWVRFSYGEVTHNKAVENTRVLIAAAERAGVQRIVHISITNASENSTLPYFRGKGFLETAVRQSRLSYAIIRPTLIFGPEDILINNIAWFLRRCPIFAVPGDGNYRLQPVFVEDVAEIAVNGAVQGDSLIIDAVGPDILTFDELIRLIAGKIQSRAKIVHLKPGLALMISRLLGAVLRDVVLTRDEVEGLMANLLVSEGAPTGQTRLTEWLEQNRLHVGTKYASELDRHYR
jgi:NADH dehydrogenase